ncbi:CLUMA_CG003618, isoform A [Clunio marinus]|uniref:CLUMA_CG003618, isoform A n=1 Tax=Clunio marinus TaxID=568069 RepID=A0A1J1HQR7_9DIPT|nr:CLUMA_CG003618, isoform A [Clunio marinus]
MKANSSITLMKDFVFSWKSLPDKSSMIKLNLHNLKYCESLTSFHSAIQSQPQNQIGASPKDNKKNYLKLKIFTKRETLEVEKLVRDYYINDNISQISTNIVLKDGTSVRYMLYTIHEAYDKFNVDFPDQKIDHKKFAKLRPHFVKLKSQIPHRTCLCSIHENMGFALKALALADPTFKDVAIGYNYTVTLFAMATRKNVFPTNVAYVSINQRSSKSSNKTKSMPQNR